MHQAIEWRVGYRRDGGREVRYKLFQSEARANQFVEKLLGCDRPDLPALVWWEICTRPVGAWRVLTMNDLTKETA